MQAGNSDCYPTEIRPNGVSEMRRGAISSVDSLDARTSADAAFVGRLFRRQMMRGTLGLSLTLIPCLSGCQSESAPSPVPAPKPAPAQADAEPRFDLTEPPMEDSSAESGNAAESNGGQETPAQESDVTEQSPQKNAEAKAP